MFKNLSKQFKFCLLTFIIILSTIEYDQSHTLQASSLSYGPFLELEWGSVIGSPFQNGQLPERVKKWEKGSERIGGQISWGEPTEFNFGLKINNNRSMVASSLISPIGSYPSTLFYNGTELGLIGSFPIKKAISLTIGMHYNFVRKISLLDQDFGSRPSTENGTQSLQKKSTGSSGRGDEQKIQVQFDFKASRVLCFYSGINYVISHLNVNTFSENYDVETRSKNTEKKESDIKFQSRSILFGFSLLFERELEKEDEKKAPKREKSKNI